MAPTRDGIEYLLWRHHALADGEVTTLYAVQHPRRSTTRVPADVLHMPDGAVSRQRSRDCSPNMPVRSQNRIGGCEDNARLTSRTRDLRRDRPVMARAVSAGIGGDSRHEQDVSALGLRDCPPPAGGSGDLPRDMCGMERCLCRFCGGDCLVHSELLSDGRRASVCLCSLDGRRCRSRPRWNLAAGLERVSPLRSQFHGPHCPSRRSSRRL
jgi:hypothetical protein